MEVAYADGPGLGAWAPEFDRVSDFLAVQGAWQAVGGGLPVTALVTGTIVAGVAPPDGAQDARVKAAAARHARERIAARWAWTRGPGTVRLDLAHRFERLWSVSVGLSPKRAR